MTIASQLRPRIDRIGNAHVLDTLADQLERVARPRLEPPAVKNALSGVWLGHRLHPLLTDVAIGAFSSAALVDVLAPRHGRIARRLIGAGILAAVPTAASGLSDWLDTHDDARRIGLVHMASNSLALSLYLRSWRRRGRGKGRLSSLAGLGVLSMSGYLGGHLAYVLGVGVDHTAFAPRIDEWRLVAASQDVPEGGHTVASAAGNDILLVRHAGVLRAYVNQCSHAGWSLGQGKFEGGCVTCPGHGSIFDLSDGSVQRGPAASPQPCYQVREQDGQIEVRS